MKFKVNLRPADSWLLEICALTGSILCMGAIFALLWVYQDKPPLRWHGITLNAFVAIFSTIARSLLAFTLSNSLGQWKWRWFSGGRNPLIDFEIINDASRGPLGSFRLLWRTKGAAFAAIGAAVTILSLAMQPFVQQVIGLKTIYHTELEKSAFVPRAERYSKGYEFRMSNAMRVFENFEFAGTEVEPDFGIMAATSYGLSQPQDVVAKQLPFNCPTSSCQWDEFPSLAICSHCTDISELLSREDIIEENPLGSLLSSSGLYIANLTQYTLPNGLYINDVGTVMAVAYGTGNSSETLTYQTNNRLVWSMTIIKATNTSEEDPVSATECGLYYCVNNYKSEAVNGTLQEMVTPAPSERSLDSWQPTDGGANSRPVNESWPRYIWDNLQFDPGLASILRTDLQLEGGFNVSQAAVDSISGYMQRLFTNSVDRNPNGGLNAFALVPGRYKPNSMQSLYESNDLNATFAALAISMSNSIRTGSDNNLMAKGQAETSTIVVDVRWEWLILPWALILLGCVFLALAAWETRKTQIAIWKSSALVILSQGYQVKHVLGEARLTSEMEKRAKEGRVQVFVPNSVETFSE